MGNVEDGLKTRAGSSGFQYALERQGAIFQRYVSRIPNTLVIIDIIRKLPLDVPKVQ